MLNKLVSKHGKNVNFDTPKSQNDGTFGIRHFAGPVRYNTSGECQHWLVWLTNGVWSVGMLLLLCLQWKVDQTFLPLHLPRVLHIIAKRLDLDLVRWLDFKPGSLVWNWGDCDHFNSTKACSLPRLLVIRNIHFFKVFWKEIVTLFMLTWLNWSNLQRINSWNKCFKKVNFNHSWREIKIIF